jgi:hypothetical protein
VGGVAVNGGCGIVVASAPAVVLGELSIAPTAVVEVVTALEVLAPPGGTVEVVPGDDVSTVVVDVDGEVVDEVEVPACVVVDEDADGFVVVGGVVVVEWVVVEVLECVVGDEDVDGLVVDVVAVVEVVECAVVDDDAEDVDGLIVDVVEVLEVVGVLVDDDDVGAVVDEVVGVVDEVVGEVVDEVVVVSSGGGMMCTAQPASRISWPAGQFRPG